MARTVHMSSVDVGGSTSAVGGTLLRVVGPRLNLEVTGMSQSTAKAPRFKVFFSWGGVTIALLGLILLAMGS